MIYRLVHVSEERHCECWKPSACAEPRKVKLSITILEPLKQKLRRGSILYRRSKKIVQRSASDFVGKVSMLNTYIVYATEVFLETTFQPSKPRQQQFAAERNHC